MNTMYYNVLEKGGREWNNHDWTKFKYTGCDSIACRTVLLVASTHKCD